jgi:hypothetical protein
VAVAGSVSCSPTPVRRDKPTTLFADVHDAERGGGTVAAAEYTIGSAPATGRCRPADVRHVRHDDRAGFRGARDRERGERQTCA